MGTAPPTTAGQNPAPAPCLQGGCSRALHPGPKGQSTLNSGAHRGSVTPKPTQRAWATGWGRTGRFPNLGALPAPPRPALSGLPPACSYPRVDFVAKHLAGLREQEKRVGSSVWSLRQAGTPGRPSLPGQGPGRGAQQSGQGQGREGREGREGLGLRTCTHPSLSGRPCNSPQGGPAFKTPHRLLPTSRCRRACSPTPRLLREAATRGGSQSSVGTGGQGRRARRGPGAPSMPPFCRSATARRSPPPWPTRWPAGTATGVGVAVPTRPGWAWGRVGGSNPPPARCPGPPLPTCPGRGPAYVSDGLWLTTVFRVGRGPLMKPTDPARV